MAEVPHIRSRLVGVNIPAAERVVTALLGGAAITYGLRSRSLRGLALAGLGTLAVARAATGRCPLYRARAVRRGIHVRRAITIQATPKEIYQLWRDLRNVPRFMQHVASVTVDGDISTWIVKSAGRQLTWRAEIVEDMPDRRLRWRSLPGGDLRHAGELDLRPAPADRGTIVELKLHYIPPGGLLVASTLYGFLRRITAMQIAGELARLQQLVETGEITIAARRLDSLAEDNKFVAGAPR